jgi:hypothetical protein
MNWKTGLRAAVLGAVLLGAPEASAFCGFYVSGATGELYNNATQVVLMREGTRTVLSMANNYQGPPSDFAMVVPVPVVLQKENVKTLPPDIFKKLDQLTAPRLVEYWEQDPCYQPPPMQYAPMPPMAMGMPAPAAAPAASLGVRIEAKFAVGEYEVVILSAENAMGLDTWLRQEKYNIPEGAEPVLKPYVQAGMKFFVAKVDVEKVKFKDGQATLSPLRFHFDDDRFFLPVRLGLLNSSGTQDLIVNILARERYEVANYPNVTIPTNLELSPRGKENFGAFYAALFDRTAEKNPKAVITEYAWNAGTCDPCPGPALSPTDLTLLGGDVAPDPPPGPGQASRNAQKLSTWNVTLTRLHTRYTRDALGDDLVFRKATPISGGNENWSGTNSQEATPLSAGGTSMFQGRYIVRHPWEGKITCTDPKFGRWGGPPGGAKRPETAQNLAFAPRGKNDFAAWLTQDVNTLGLKGTPAPPPQRTYDVPLSAHFRGPRWPLAAGFFLGLTAVGLLAWRSRRAS